MKKRRRQGGRNTTLEGVEGNRGSKEATGCKEEEEKEEATWCNSKRIKEEEEKAATGKNR